MLLWREGSPAYRFGPMVIAGPGLPDDGGSVSPALLAAFVRESRAVEAQVAELSSAPYSALMVGDNPLRKISLAESLEPETQRLWQACDGYSASRTERRWKPKSVGLNAETGRAACRERVW